MGVSYSSKLFALTIPLGRVSDNRDGYKITAAIRKHVKCKSDLQSNKTLRRSEFPKND